MGLLDYEQEYIVFGKSSDKDNFKAAVSSISAIRLGCNMTYILTDTQKRVKHTSLQWRHLVLREWQCL